jgi:Zn-dependent M32 family carboxypeptidase
MVLMQQAILRMQSTNERTQSRKKKNDTQGDASHTLDERTKKQLKISVAQQVDYDKRIGRLSEISHDHMDFFGFVPPSLIGGIQCTTCGKKKDIILKFA